jgi:DNA primase
VSTPITWAEVEAGAAGDAALKFDYRDVLDRVDRFGDLFEAVLTTKQSLPAS